MSDDALGKAHRHFSAGNFNAAWDLIDLPGRSPAQNDDLLLTAMASLWHWTRREDCGPRHRSIGWWQCSRAAVLAGHAALALHCGERCLSEAALDGGAPFYVGFGHEAVARAAAAAGDGPRRDEHLALARRQAALVEDAGERGMLEADLTTIPA